MWVVQREFDQLHNLLAEDKRRKERIQENAKKLANFKENLTSQANNIPVQGKVSTVADIQDKLREKLEVLLKHDKHNRFYQSLHNWRGNFSAKQANCIVERYKELAEKENFDELPSSLTEEEKNDPNWTPWKD